MTAAIRHRTPTGLVETAPKRDALLTHVVEGRDSDAEGDIRVLAWYASASGARRAAIAARKTGDHEYVVARKINGGNIPAPLPSEAEAQYTARAANENVLEDPMAPARKTRKTAAATKAKPAPKRTARKAPAKKAPAKTEAKQRMTAEDRAAMIEHVVELRDEKDMTLKEISAEVGLDAGTVAMLFLIHEADENPKLVRKTNKANAAKAISEMRTKDALSWGQITARLFIDGERVTQATVRKIFKESGGEFGLVHDIRRGDESEKAPAKRTRKAAAKPAPKAPAKTAKKAPARRAAKRTRKSASDPS